MAKSHLLLQLGLGFTDDLILSNVQLKCCHFYNTFLNPHYQDKSPHCPPHVVIECINIAQLACVSCNLIIYYLFVFPDRLRDFGGQEHP